MYTVRGEGAEGTCCSNIWIQNVSLRELARSLACAAAGGRRLGMHRRRHRQQPRQDSSAVCEPQSTPVPEGSKLLGKVALVTGSSEGIGAGIALAMAQAGADVCINFIGDPTPAEALADDIRKLGRRVVLSNADV